MQIEDRCCVLGTPVESTDGAYSRTYPLLHSIFSAATQTVVLTARFEGNVPFEENACCWYFVDFGCLLKMQYWLQRRKMRLSRLPIHRQFIRENHLWIIVSPISLIFFSLQILEYRRKIWICGTQSTSIILTLDPHYVFRKELVDYCQKNGIDSEGRKQVLAERFYQTCSPALTLLGLRDKYISLLLKIRSRKSWNGLEMRNLRTNRVNARANL